MLLAGGRAHRLGGVHKPGLVIGGRPVLQRVTSVVSDAERIIIAGHSEHAPDRAIVVCEDPPGSGPVPALRAAMPYVTAAWLALLAADLPFLRDHDIWALHRRAQDGCGAVLVDDHGHEQWLTGIWESGVLRRSLAGYGGGSLHGLLRPLQPFRLRPEVPGNTPPPWLDCDTMGDLDVARGWTCTT